MFDREKIRKNINTMNGSMDKFAYPRHTRICGNLKIAALHLRLSQFQRRTFIVSHGIKQTGRRFTDIAQAMNIFMNFIKFMEC